MTLSDLASLGSFVSGVAVLVSLIFLYFQLRQINEQVRQAETNQRAALTQGYVTRAMDTSHWFLENGIIDLQIRAMAGDTNFLPDELSKLGVALRVLVLNAQDTFLAHRAGLIDQMIFDTAMVQLRVCMGQPAFRALWILTAQRYAPDFCTEVERIIAETPLAAPSGDRSDNFKNALAKVLEHSA